MRSIAAIAASAAFVATLLVSSVSFACEGKPCRADFDCDTHHMCMQWQNGSATCESPGANPVMPMSNRTTVQSCKNDLECSEGWRCEMHAQRDGVPVSSAECVPESRQSISY